MCVERKALNALLAAQLVARSAVCDDGIVVVAIHAILGGVVTNSFPIK